MAKLKKKSKSPAKKSLKPVSVKKAKSRATVKKGSTVRKKTVKRAAAVKRTSAQRLATGAGEARTSLVGEKATTMIRPATGGKNISLQDFKRLKSEFAAKNTVVLGVSKDSLKSHESFKEKCGFPFDLLVDEDESFCRSFDVIKLKKLYGREFMGIERSTFVIDEDGLILKEWRKVKVDGHADEVLEFIGTLD